MEPEREKDETVNVRINPDVSTIQAGDLITARDSGYHAGYLTALRHAALIVFGCVMLAVFIEGRNH